jgi:hypothetical protein
MKKVIDNKTRGKAIGFLIWFRSQYQVWTNDTYYKIAEKYGQCNYGTCRNLIIELVEAGYLTIWDDGIHKRRFYIDQKKYNELVNPFIFQKNDSRTESTHQPQD